MRKTALLMTLLLSFGVTGCSSSGSNSNYSRFVSNSFPIDNSKIELEKGYLSDKDNFFNGKEETIDYEEYYSSTYDEYIRLYEDNYFLYYSQIGSLKAYCYRVDDLFTLNYHDDVFLFKIDGDKVVNLDKLSISKSGFSFNGREFVHKEKEQPIVSKYLYSYEDPPIYEIGFSLEGVLSRDKLLKMYHLEKYTNYVVYFNATPKFNETSICFEMTDFSRFLNDVNYFCELNKNQQFKRFSFNIYGRCIGHRLNIEYYSLKESDIFNDYQFYGSIYSYYHQELEQMGDVDRIFTSKKELNDFILPIRQYDNIGNYNGVKQLADNVAEEMFDSYNLLVTRETINTRFDKIYMSNNELFIVLISTGSNWNTIEKICHVFFLPKDLAFQKINICY